MKNEIHCEQLGNMGSQNKWEMVVVSANVPATNLNNEPEPVHELGLPLLSRALQETQQCQNRPQRRAEKFLENMDCTPAVK